jgi:hypothetical protein
MLILVLCVTGCASFKRLNTHTSEEDKVEVIVEEPLPFDKSEYTPYKGIGKAIVTGQAFLVANGGEVIVGAGRTIGLVPKTTASTIWTTRQFISETKIESGLEPDGQGVKTVETVPSDEQISEYNRTTIGDAEGRFRFEGVPAGTYYLRCNITWMIFGGTSGGMVSAEVVVKSAGTVNVEVTRRQD